MFWKNPAELRRARGHQVLELAMRVIFMLYGKKVQRVEQEGRCGRDSWLST